MIQEQLVLLEPLVLLVLLVLLEPLGLLVLLEPPVIQEQLEQLV